MVLNARQKGAARLEENLTLRSKLMDGFVTPLDLAKQRSSDGAMLQLLEKSAQTQPFSAHGRMSRPPSKASKAKPKSKD